ncbi:hypothetical protein Hdeb2414_s0021g00579421 [Helianthus debilis subsp. tardiflorus]
MKKRKVLDDKKKELDDQAAAALAAKRAKLQKENPPAPSESEIDMGVFSAKPGNLLEEIYVSSGSRGGAVDVGGAGDGDRGKGIETEAKSSETTPHQSIYTRRPPGSCGGGVTSGVARSPEFENIRAGSWDTHNPTCDDLPHAPRWKLTQGSRMNDHDNCREFFSFSLPPAERLFQKRHNRFDLLDDHIHAGVNFFASSQEIVQEWKLMGEDTLDFENAKRARAEEREKFDAEKKGLLWRVSDAEQKLVREKQREAIVRLSGEKAKISDEAEEERTAHQRKEREYVERITKLEAFVEEKNAENKASEILAEEMSTDCKWLLTRAVPLAAYNSGRKDGYDEGRAATSNNEKDYHFELFKEDCTGKYAAKRRDYEFIEFGIVKAVEKLSRRGNAIEVLKKALGDESHGTGGAGTSHQG